MFCRLWRVLVPGLQRPSKQCVCVSPSGGTWWASRAAGKGPIGLAGLEGRAITGSMLGDSIGRESCHCKYSLAYSKLIALANKIAVSACTVSCLIPTVGAAQDSLTPVSIKLLSEFHFKIIQDP